MKCPVSASLLIVEIRRAHRHTIPFIKIAKQIQKNRQLPPLGT